MEAWHGLIGTFEGGGGEEKRFYGERIAMFFFFTSKIIRRFYRSMNIYMEIIQNGINFSKFDLALEAGQVYACDLRLNNADFAGGEAAIVGRFFLPGPQIPSFTRQSFIAPAYSNVTYELFNALSIN